MEPLTSRVGAFISALHLSHFPCPTLFFCRWKFPAL